MANTLVVEISNGVIAIITGVTLYGITRMFRWVRSVDKRLDRIEKAIPPGAGQPPPRPPKTLIPPAAPPE